MFQQGCLGLRMRTGGSPELATPHLSAGSPCGCLFGMFYSDPRFLLSPGRSIPGDDFCQFQNELDYRARRNFLRGLERLSKLAALKESVPGNRLYLDNSRRPSHTLICRKFVSNT